ncbi:hypothetical protein [Tannerella forsythia]
MMKYNKLTSFGRIFTIYASTRLLKQASYVRKGLFLEYDSTYSNEEGAASNLHLTNNGEITATW